jgi:protein SCO1
MDGHRAKVALALLGTWVVVAMGYWALAFYPLSAAAPEWLIRTRYVCFGAPVGGLPDGGGWITLIGGPLLLLAAMLVAFSAELRGALGRLHENRTALLVAVALGLGLVSEVVWAVAQVHSVYAAGTVTFEAREDGGLPDPYPRQDRPAPAFTLVDQRGATVDLAALRGKNVVLTFAFAHCATVCPALIAQTKSALARLDAASTAGVFITLDPWRDTPSALPALAERWTLPANAHLLSGDVREVVSTLEAYKVPFTRDEKTGNVDHPALVYVIDSQGRIAFVFNNPPVDWVVTAVARLDEDRG